MATIQRRDFTDLSSKFVGGQTNTTAWAHMPATGSLTTTAIDMQGLTKVTLQVTADDGTASAVNLTVQGSLDGTNFYAIPGVSAITVLGSLSTITANVIKMRLTGSITGGPVSVTFYATR